VETYFGPLEAQPQPKHPDTTEPGEPQTRADVYRDPLARVPAVLLGWPGPKRRSPDYNAMVMLDLVLTEGDSSRFQQGLVKGRQSVVRFEASLGYPMGGSSEYVDPGVYGVFLTHQPKIPGREVASQVEEELAKIQKDGIPVKELDRARAQWRASRIREMQSALNRATLLAQYELLDGKPEWITEELDAFLSVTPAQVQAAAKKYLVPEKRVTLEIVPAPKEAK
jgi:predicted Zn-dependent peptidase